MAIKTHYALAQDNETDNAKLTPRASHGSDTKMYLPCNEGAGTIVTDFSAEGYILDNADANVTVGNGTAANTMNIQQWDGAGSGQAPNNGDISNISPAGNSFVMFLGVDIITLSSLAAFVLGDNTSGGGAGVEGSNHKLYDGSTTITIAAGVVGVAGETWFGACVVDKSTNIVTIYHWRNGVRQDNVTEDISSLGNITFADEMQVSAGAAQDVYGLGYRIFPSGVPSTIEEDVIELNTNIMGSSKVLPTNWLVNQ